MRHPARGGGGRAQGELQRYLYVELSLGTDLEPVARAIRSDPLFLGESLQIFAVPSVAQLEEVGHGVLLRRLSSSSVREHRSFLQGVHLTCGIPINT